MSLRRCIMKLIVTMANKFQMELSEHWSNSKAETANFLLLLGYWHVILMVELQHLCRHWSHKLECYKVWFCTWCHCVSQGAPFFVTLNFRAWTNHWSNECTDKVQWSWVMCFCCLNNTPGNSSTAGITQCTGRSSCQQCKSFEGGVQYAAHINGYLALAWIEFVNITDDGFHCFDEASCMRLKHYLFKIGSVLVSQAAVIVNQVVRLIVVMKSVIYVQQMAI